ncbi:DUF1822 family protein [Oscillatoria acuminata]|nr:DUF1822 family protein [Oscillatoria acuminata]
MPQRKNLTWGEIPQQRVRRFLEVLLSSRNDSPEILQIEWQKSQADRHRLWVKYTTKANLVKLMTGMPYPSEKKKAEIQDAIAHLEELQILTDLRPVKTGPKAENLSFYLELPSQDPTRIMQFIFQEKWFKKSSHSRTNLNGPEDDGTSFANPDEVISASRSEYELIAEVEQQGNQKVVRWKIKFTGDLASLTPEKIQQIQTVVREITGDDQQTMMKITEGSIIIEFAGSEAGFEQILDLFNRGELTEIAGLAVESVEPAGEPVKLTQWQPDSLPVGWQAIGSLLSSSQMQLAFGWRSTWEPEIIGGQLINIAGIDLVFIMALAQEAEATTRICVQVHPTPGSTHLPGSLELILLDQENRPILTTAIAKATSGFVQLDFRGDPGEPFTVQIALDSNKISKNFLI